MSPRLSGNDVSEKERMAGGAELPGLPVAAHAPAKINLGLFLGPTRVDGRHELVTVMQSISLADALTLRAMPAGARDVVVCPGVPGSEEENLAARALAAFRAATRWGAPPLELTIEKRVPVAAGLGGGSGDAAAALRLAAAAASLGSGSGLGWAFGLGSESGSGSGSVLGLGSRSGLSEEEEALLGELARSLGADVPAQVRPGRWLASGAGELLQPLRDPTEPFGVLILPAAAGLSTAVVYAQADLMGASRTRAELERAHTRLAQALGGGAALPPAELLENDLQDAARALCPEIDAALEQALAAGADVALVSGSGPTVLGLFAGSEGSSRARAAADALAELRRARGALPPMAAEPVGAAFGAVGTAADGVGGGADRAMRHNSPI